MLRSPRLCEISVTLFMLRPRNATLRPNSCDRSRIICRRWMDELKQEMTSRPSARLIDIFKPGTDGPLTLGVPGPVDVRRVAHQQQHTAPSIIRKGVQVKQLVIRGSRIDFEVARMNNDAERRGDRQRNRAHDRMRHPNELDLETDRAESCRSA